MSKGLNDLTWYRLALAGKAPPVHDDDRPARGFYRARRKGDAYKPVAIWYTDDNNPDSIICVVGGEQVSTELARRSWPYISKNPITHDWYKLVHEQGKPWPDIDQIVAAQQEQTKIGHNNPPEDPSVLLKEQIESATAGIRDYEKIDSDEAVKKAQTLRSRLIELHGEAEAHREKLNRPLLEAKKANDKIWMQLGKDAQEAANKIRHAIEVWITAQMRKAEAVQAAAQAKVEAAAKAAPAAVPLPPAPPEPLVNVPTQIRGAAGRTASVGTRRVAVRISNLEALWHSMKGRQSVLDFLLLESQKILDDNQDVLGIEIETMARVK